MAAKTIVLRVKDYIALASIVRQRRLSGRLREDHLYRLEEELARAQLRPDNSLPDNIVTLNSVVRFRDLKTNEAGQLAVVFPAEAGSAPDRVSIFAPLGAALIGEREGTTVRCTAPMGTRRLLIEKIIGRLEHADQEK